MVNESPLDVSVSQRIGLILPQHQGSYPELPTELHDEDVIIYGICETQRVEFNGGRDEEKT